MPVKTGIVAAVVFVKELCRVLRVWRPAIDGVVNQAVTSGLITTGQKAQVDQFFDVAQGACDVLRIITGY